MGFWKRGYPVLPGRVVLAKAPDDMEVMISVENHLHPGMFAFAPACAGETGISTLGSGTEGEEGSESVFLVLPHGFGVSEDEGGVKAISELN